MKKLQEKFKDDQTKLSQATMELYKKEGVNPLGGCLPILVQMPLLIALFQVFRKTIEFRGAEFLPFWITYLAPGKPQRTQTLLQAEGSAPTALVMSNTTG